MQSSSGSAKYEDARSFVVMKRVHVTMFVSLRKGRMGQSARRRKGRSILRMSALM